jgi:hypothetical protein
MHLPDDLDEYLRGDSALSRQYRRESAPMPPHALDRRVQKLSREAHGSRAVRDGTPCLAPLAFAASVLLSVALVLAIVFGPQAAKRADDAPRLVRVAAHADVPADAPLNRKLQLYSSDPKLARTPSSWLADIAALRRAGRTREADEEYRRFRSAYPGYSTGEFRLQP